ncbi:MAG: Ig-like domain-containing protein [Syntrophomonas sp.]|nr:Ig-like domain-containing protein [Syntrophomonas sp.]
MNKKLYTYAIAGLVIFLSFFIVISAYGADKPVVSTTGIHTEGNKATLNGVITDDGGKKISCYGFKWGTSPTLQEEEIFHKNIEASISFSKTISVEPGNTYYFQAYAVNSKGSAYGEVKSFTVPPIYNDPPEVVISSPADNSSYTAGETVGISAAAADDNKIQSMKLYINGVLKNEAQEGKLVFNWETSSLPAGKYTLKVDAWDGDKTGTSEISVNVEAKPPANNAPVTSIKKPVATENSGNNNREPVSRGTSSTATSTVKNNISTNSTYHKLSKVQGSYGQFRYKDTTGGRIEIDPQWVAENIVTITLPGLNRKVQVHKDAADNFIQAFNYIKNGTAVVNGRQVSLLSLVKTMDGTFVSRHVNWDSSRGLSNHSWGIAIDINAGNHYRYVDPSKEPNDPNLILWQKAFKPAGFSWGNSYSDSMHFELLN